MRAGRGIGIDGAAALDALMPMHVVVDREFRIVHAGPTMRRLRPEAGWLGERFLDVFEVRRPKALDLNLADGHGLHGVTLHVQIRGGSKTNLKAVLAPAPDGESCIVNFGFGIGVVDAVRKFDLSASDFAPTDLTIEMLYLVEAKSAVMEESRDLNRRLQIARRAAEQQAQTDPLTGVRNRRALEGELHRLIEEGLPFGLMVIDLDFFKAINDTMGHAAGDHVLKTVAQIIGEESRRSDTVARVGGDEFVILLPDMTTKPAIEAMAERIIRRVAQPIVFEGMPCQVAASIGSTRSSLYTVPTVERMSHDADIALYHSKRQGRERHTCAFDVEDVWSERRSPEARAGHDGLAGTPPPSN
jgi:diguanylate cyclase (GGDEF)-like protein